MESKYKIVIGLEVHVQLNTCSKIFSSSSTLYGQTPNSQANVIDLGLPGVLPVLNKGVLEKAIKVGFALNSDINRLIKFDRKQYFYPDLPKGYQITQDTHPIILGGYLNINLGDQEKKIRIHHAHLEEDAGKSIHDNSMNVSKIDLNRAGSPLLEIVTEPDIRSIDEAIAFLKKIHQLVCYLDVSDGNMQEGSFRCDANISLRLAEDSPMGTRVEIKNINSFKFIEKALKYEISRQSKILDSNDKIAQETRLYDEKENTTRSMRSKETANDYRYFNEPDVPSIAISEAFIQAVSSQLPEMPAVKKQKYINHFSLPEYDADVISANIHLASFFEKVCALKAPAKLTANILLGPLLSLLNKYSIGFDGLNITPKDFAELVVVIDKGMISISQCKDILDIMYNENKSPHQIIEENNLAQISDPVALSEFIDEVINANHKQVEQYNAGKEKLFGFFVGQVMKLSQGKANPSLINKLIKDKLIIK